MDNSSKSNGHIGGQPEGTAAPLDKENKQQLETLQTDHQRHAVGEELSTYLKRISDDIETLDRERRMNLFRQQLKAHKYFDGNFFGYVNSDCEWVDAHRENGEIWYSDNQLYAYFRTALMELSRTQTEVIITANSQSEKMQNVARFAKARYDSNREKTFTAKLKQTENAYALLNGITYRYTFPQFDHKEGRQERIPKLIQREGGEPSSAKFSLCAACGRRKPSDSDTKDILGAEYVNTAKCRCGSEIFTEIDDVASQTSEVTIGYDEVPRCQNAWIVPNPISIIVSMQASDITETPFIKWKQLIVRSVLENKFKGMTLPSTGTESLELRYITDRQTATPGEGAGMFDTDYGILGNQADSKTELELLEFHQVWLDYAVYCNKTFKNDQPLSDGRVLKAGQPMGSMWTKGMYYAKVGDAVLDIWNEDKNKKWASSPYGLRPGSMYGTGSSVCLSDQELLNDLMRLKMANAWNNGVPREFVDPSIIPEISADPSIPTNFNGEVGMKDVIGRGYAQAPATPLSGEVYAIVQEQKDNIQGKTGAMSGTGSGGLSDAQKWGDTATAISIKRDLAVGRFSPDLQLMADQLDREQAYQFLENEKEYFTPAQWDDLKGENGGQAVADFLECDIRRDLNVTISPGSYMPKSDAQVQSKVVAIAQFLPALMQTGNKELVSYALDVFGMPENLGIWNADRLQASRVVGRFQEICDVVVQQNGDIPHTNLEDPAVLQAVEWVDQQANVPVDYFLDNHEAMIESFRDLRATDEGREWPHLLTACVSRRVLEHQAGIAKQQQMLARTVMAAQEPMQEAAQAEQQAAAEAQNAQAEQLANQESQAQEAQMIDKMVEYNDRDEQREHEKELTAAQIAAKATEKAARNTVTAR